MLPKINVSVVVGELPSQIPVYTCLTIDTWTRQHRHTSTRFYALWCYPPEMPDFPVKTGAKSFQLYYRQPWLARKRLVRAMQCTQICAKITENDLKLADF
jgi:hypothetical protein